MADTYIPDTDNTRDDPDGLLAFLTRSGAVDPDQNQTSAPAPPNVNEASSQPRIAPPTGASVATPTYTAPTDQQLQQPSTPVATLQQPDSEPAAPASYASQAPVYKPMDEDMLQALQQQKSKDAAPIDPKTVGPKWYERLGGALVGGAMAFGGQPGALAAGQAITNQRANAATSSQQAKVAQDDAGIQDYNDQSSRNDKLYQTSLQGFDAKVRGVNTDENIARSKELIADRAAQEQQRLQGVAPGTETPDDPGNPLGTWHATTVGGKKIALEGPPDKWAKSPAGVAAQRDADVKRLSLAGDDAKYYRANGKLKEPSAQTNIRIPSEGLQRYSDAKAAFVRENGRQPNASELATLGVEQKGGGKGQRGTAGQFSDLDKQTAAAYAKAEAEYKTAAEGSPDENGKAEALASLNQEKARIGSEHSQRLRDLGGIPAEDAQGGPGANANAKAAPAPTPQHQGPQVAKVQAGTVKVGQKVSFNGRAGTVTGISPAGKPIVAWGQ